MKRNLRNATPSLGRGVAWRLGVALVVALGSACAREVTDAGSSRVERELARAELVAFASGAVTSKPELVWDLPDGWRSRGPSSRLAASFYVRGNPRVRCQLTLLAGDGGGLAETIERWRLEYGLGPASPEDLAALPTVPFLEREARVVDLESRRGDAGADRAARVALVACDARGSALFELAGPRELVNAERGSFLALARSMEVRSARTASAGDP